MNCPINGEPIYFYFKFNEKTYGINSLNNFKNIIKKLLKNQIIDTLNENEQLEHLEHISCQQVKTMIAEIKMQKLKPLKRNKKKSCKRIIC
jgi:hypothetical protein